MSDAKTTKGEINFYDSNTGNLLFTAPNGRTMEEFLTESRRHGACCVVVFEIFVPVVIRTRVII